jgi:hypothetical protein
MSSKNKQKKKPNPVGRPTDYKPEYCQMLIDHMEKVYSFESFAGVIGVARETIYLWRKTHPEFLHAHNVGKMKVQLGVEKMFKGQSTGQLKGSPASLIFWAKNITTMRDEPLTQDEGYEDMEFLE